MYASVDPVALVWVAALLAEPRSRSACQLERIRQPVDFTLAAIDRSLLAAKRRGLANANLDARARLMLVARVLGSAKSPWKLATEPFGLSRTAEILVHAGQFLNLDIDRARLLDLSTTCGVRFVELHRRVKGQTKKARRRLIAEVLTLALADPVPAVPQFEPPDYIVAVDDLYDAGTEPGRLVSQFLLTRDTQYLIRAYNEAGLSTETSLNQRTLALFQPEIGHASDHLTDALLNIPRTPSVPRPNPQQ